MNWHLILQTKIRSSICINSEVHPEGTEIHRQIEASSVVYNIDSANNSFITSTITILNPISINETMIICNGNTLLLIVKNASKL